MNLICKDIPDHGLLLVNLADPFAEEAALSLKEELQLLSRNVRSYCIAFVNNSYQDVVAYMLVWKLHRKDGSQHSDEKSFSNVDVLMGKEDDQPLNPNLDDPSIRPGYFRLFSTKTHTPIANAGVARSFGIGAATGAYSPQFKWMSNDYETVVTIDGAFFKDGTFVGPDDTGYFESVSCEIKAKRNLVEEIAARFKSDGSLNKLFQELHDSGTVEYRPHLNVDEKYAFYRHLFIQELFSLRRVLGDIAVVGRTQRELERPWPKLRKI